MKAKLAVLCGALIWVLIFFEVSILMFGFKLQPGLTYYTIHYILAAIITGSMSWFYFSRKKVEAGLQEGFLVGLVFVIIGMVLDAVITVPLFVKSYAFFDKMLFIGLIEGIIVTGIVGKIKEKY